MPGYKAIAWVSSVNPNTHSESNTLKNIHAKKLQSISALLCSFRNYAPIPGTKSPYTSQEEFNFFFPQLVTTCDFLSAAFLIFQEKKDLYVHHLVNN